MKNQNENMKAEWKKQPGHAWRLETGVQWMDAIIYAQNRDLSGPYNTCVNNSPISSMCEFLTLTEAQSYAEKELLRQVKVVQAALT